MYVCIYIYMYVILIHSRVPLYVEGLPCRSNDILQNWRVSWYVQRSREPSAARAEVGRASHPGPRLERGRHLIIICIIILCVVISIGYEYTYDYDCHRYQLSCCCYCYVYCYHYHYYYHYHHYY